MDPETRNKSIPELMKHLDGLYDKEEKIQDAVAKLYKMFEQNREDIELLEMFIMHKYNKESRKNEYA